MQVNPFEFFVENARYTYRMFSLIGRQVAGTDIVLEGEAILKFLGDAKAVVILAATLGIEADRRIASAQAASISEALSLNTLANEAIEEVCKQAQAEIAAKYNITAKRFSPGYGDFPLKIQPQILAALDAQKRIGLYCNAGNLLIPMKSVTAFMGVLT